MLSMQKRTTLGTFATACPPARANRTTMLITEFVARDLRSISTVDGKGFQQLLRFVEPGYKMPSRPYLTITCRRLCSSLKKQLLETLASCNVAITTNLWMSKATEGYLTVTAHSCSHCAMCSKWLQEATSKWNVERRVIAVVWDNSGNMEGAVQNLGWEMCLALRMHTLQLAINNGLNLSQVSRVTAAPRKLVGHLKHSVCCHNYLEWEAATNVCPSAPSNSGCHHKMELNLFQPISW